MLLYNICYRRPDLPATYKAPAVPASKITPQFVRNELLTCFESANREFARVLKQPVTDEALKQQVRQFVTSVFSQVGVSFGKATEVGIETAIEECKKNAEAMMGAKESEVILLHNDEVVKLVTKPPA